MIRKMSFSLAIAIALGSVLSVASPAMAGKKPSVSSCAVGFSTALPEAVFKAQKYGTFLTIEFFSTPFKAKVLYSKQVKDGKKYKTETWYFLVECGSIKGPYKKY